MSNSVSEGENTSGVSLKDTSGLLFISLKIVLLGVTGMKSNAEELTSLAPFGLALILLCDV